MNVTRHDCYIRPNTSLKRILRDFHKDYESYVNSYYDIYIKSLPTGAILPAKDRIYTEQGNQAFNDVVREYRELINYIFDNELEKVHEKLTEAPDANISAMIGMLATRDNITDAELTHLLDKYGSNHQVYKALQDIGKRHDITILDDEITTREKELSTLKRSIEEAVNPSNVQSRGMAFYDFLDEPIDNTLTDMF